MARRYAFVLATLVACEHAGLENTAAGLEEATWRGGTPSVDEVWFDVGTVRVHHESEGWIVVADALGDGVRRDLRELVVETLETYGLPDGLYDELRLEILDAEVEVEADWYPLDVRSSKLAFQGSWCVEDSDTGRLRLLQGLRKRVQGDGGDYWLTPELVMEQTVDPCGA